MSNLQMEWTEDELLATDPIVEPLIAGGVRCHGGFDADGRYVSPRTRIRWPAIEAWQRAPPRAVRHRAARHPARRRGPRPTRTSPRRKFLVGAGRARPDHHDADPHRHRRGLRRDDPLRDRRRPAAVLRRGRRRVPRSTHLQRGLVRGARARRGRLRGRGRPQADVVRGARRRVRAPGDRGRDRRDARAHGHLQRRWRARPGRDPAPCAELRVFDDIDLELEMLVQRMVSLLLIEISAFHVVRVGRGACSPTPTSSPATAKRPRIVSYIRQDESPHVEYLKTALSEMRDRTFVGESGRQMRRRRGRRRALGPRARRVARRPAGAEPRHDGARGRARARGQPRRDDLLEEFHPLGSIRPTCRRHLRAGRHVLRRRP